LGLTGTKIHWESRVKSRVTHVAGVAKFIALATVEGEIFLISPAGRYLFPCIMVGDPLAALEINGEYLLAVTAGGNVYILDIPHPKSLLNTSITSLIDSSDLSLRYARLSKNGKPTLTFSNFYSYTYHFEMQVWVRVADDKFSNSEFSTSLQLLGKAGPRGILSEVQVVTNLAPRSLHGTTQQRQFETVAHLEHQVASALLLESPEEYKYWLRTYVSRLSNEMSESKLHELCTFLLGPTSKPQPNSWDPFILKISKRDLLNELLPLIASNRSLQRLVTQFKEGLDAVKQ